MTATAVLPAAGAAFAQNQPLTCWYNDHADFTSADSAAAGATIGSVVKIGSGDKTYYYTISARDGTACPVQLPLSSMTAITVALVRQDEGSCANENVVDSGFSRRRRVRDGVSRHECHILGRIRLAGVSPNTNYHVVLKCFRQLGMIRTDANGNGGQNGRFSDRRGWSGYRIRTFAGWGTSRHQVSEPRY